MCGIAMDSGNWLISQVGWALPRRVARTRLAPFGGGFQRMNVSLSNITSLVARMFIAVVPSLGRRLEVGCSSAFIDKRMNLVVASKAHRRSGRFAFVGETESMPHWFHRVGDFVDVSPCMHGRGAFRNLLHRAARPAIC